MLPTPTLITPPTAHPTHWPETPEPAYFRAEIKKFLPITGGDRSLPTPTAGNVTRAREWYHALSAAVVDTLESLPEDASATQVIVAVQTATSADLHDETTMLAPIAAWTRQTVFTHALTAPAQLEAVGKTADARL